MFLRLGGVICFLASGTTWADPWMHRPYQSVRAGGMGNVRLTTGLYDENFWGNPARVTQNPEGRLSLVDWTPLEVSASTLSTVKSLEQETSSSQTASNYEQLLDERLHVRTQLLLLGWYRPPSESSRWAWGAGWWNALQADGLTHHNYQVDSDGVLDTGPAFTAGYTFLERRNLSVGWTQRLLYRLSLDPDYSLEQLVQGQTFSFLGSSGAGAFLELDGGVFWTFWENEAFQLSVAGSLQNLFGGRAVLFSGGPAGWSGPLLKDPLQAGVGFSVRRPGAWGPFLETQGAIEVTDVGNNPSGSWTKLLHLGAETHWKLFSLQAGINQGYGCFGVGLKWKAFQMRVATFAEELGLNAGENPSRRYALNLGVHL